MHSSKNAFFWVCLFPTILWPQQCSPQIQIFGQKWSFSPKSSKINKNWFFFKFLRQIFRVPSEVPWVWFWGHTTFFDKIMRFWKKKTKSTFFSKTRYTLNNIVFCIKSALKKIIVTVFEKKKESAFCFFFQKFFCSKSHIFVKKSRMTSKIKPKVLQEVL